MKTLHIKDVIGNLMFKIHYEGNIKIEDTSYSPTILLEESTNINPQVLVDLSILLKKEYGDDKGYENGYNAFFNRIGIKSEEL